MVRGKVTPVSPSSSPLDLSLTDVEDDLNTSRTNILNNKADKSDNNQFGYQQPHKQDKIADAVLGSKDGNGKKPEVPSWSQFTQETTFHGVKYMFEDSPRKTRRIAWTFCVCAAIAFFVGQVSYRVVEYFKYKTNVSMKVTYSDSVPFPAVTICNQNKFRITVAHEKGAYPYLNDFYSMDANEDGSRYRNEVQHLDTKLFFVEAAHEYQDLIDSCIWKGERCSDGSFREVLTDEGICYTYNTNDSNEVTESGASHALRLIINVEQYYHMRGPQKDAGVKILLHNRDEPPEMKDLGFVAAPGFHTLVAIKHSEVINLPAPHGNCLVNTDNMALCKQKCKVAQFVSACGCKDIYMDPYVDDPKVRTCNIPQLFACQRAETTNASYRAQLKQTSCECPTKCVRSIYQATLSSALLSRFNVDTMALLNATKKARARKYFSRAREISARLVPEYEEEQKYFMLKLKRSAERSLHYIISSLTLLQSSWAKFFWKASTMLKNDDLTEMIKGKNNLYQSNGDLDNYGKGITYMVQLFGLTNDEDERLRDLTAACTSDPDLNLYLGGGKCPGNAKPEGPDDRDCTEEIRLDASPGCPIEGGGDADRKWGCICYLAEQSQGLNFSTLANFETFYNDTVNNLFVNDMDKLDQISKHHSCLDLLRNATDLLITPYGSLEPLLAAFVNSSNAAAMASAGDALQTTAEGASLLPYKDIASTCWWFSTYYPGHGTSFNGNQGGSSEEDQNDKEIQHEEQEKFGKASSNAKELSYALQWLQENFVAFTKKLTILQRELHTKVMPVMVALQNYIDNKSTRKELAEKFSHQAFEKALRDVDDLSSGASEYLGDVESEVKLGLGSIKEIFEDLERLQIPFMDDKQLKNITLIKTALALNITAINTVVNLTGVSALKKVIGVKGSFVGLIDLLIPIYTEPFRNMSYIREECAFLVEGSSELQEYLKKFQDSLKMDQEFFLENFLQVDIFYNDLKYDVIEEQEAFPVLSLFGEIGGFMGLLLGASLITACEVVDYILLRMMGSTEEKKMKKQAD